jgi:hypothetical protein
MLTSEPQWRERMAARAHGRALGRHRTSEPSMRFVIFTHSLVSDWNHGNAHFLRGIATELVKRGHQRLVRRIGAHHRENHGYQLYFHDTHHRGVTDPSAMAVSAPWKDSENLFRTIHAHHTCSHRVDELFRIMACRGSG